MDPYKGEILSLAFVKPTGEELYIELEYEGEMDDWVKENILPTLTGPKVARNEALARMQEFFGETHPFLLCFINQFDTVYLYKLLNNKRSTKFYPFHWVQLDMASILFSLGIDPEQFSMDNPNGLAQKLGIDVSQYKEHKALDDARYLRDVYLKLTQQ